MPNNQLPTEGLENSGQTKIHCMMSEQIGRGKVALVIHNCPMLEVEGELKPGLRMSARQAMEVALNIIYIAKLAENEAKEADASGPSL